MSAATPFLMFQGGNAHDAMQFYTSLFDDGEIEMLELFGPGQPGAEGTVMRGRFRIAGQSFLVTDSPPIHDFDFTPSFSIWIDTDSEAQLRQLYDALLEGGQALMPVGDYGFSAQFGWVNDRFGVSWQLNLS